MAQIADPSVSFDQLVTLRPPQAATLDAKLYSGLIHMLVSSQGEDAVRLLVLVQQMVREGCGRQALRVFDADFMREGPRRRQKALAELHAMKPQNDIAQVESSVTDLRRILLELQGSPDMPSEGMIVGIARSLYGQNTKLMHLFAAHDMMPGASSASLMSSIQKACMEYRSAQASKPKAKACAGLGDPHGKGAAAKGGGKSKSREVDFKPKAKAKSKGGKDDDVCGFCGKPGHTEGKCFKKQREGKTTCQTCGKPGHASINCWHNPSSKNFKGGGGSQNNALVASQQAALTQAALASMMPASSSHAVPPSAPTTAAGAAWTPELQDQFAKFLAAQKAVKDAFGAICTNPAHTSSNELLLDSGATYHFTGSKQGELLELADPVKVVGANGLTEFSQGTLMTNAQLAQPLTAMFSPGAPRAASMGKLLKAYKLKFEWDWRDFDEPLLVHTETGERLMVKVESDCPILASAARQCTTEDQTPTEVPIHGLNSVGTSKLAGPTLNTKSLYNFTKADDEPDHSYAVAIDSTTGQEVASTETDLKGVEVDMSPEVLKFQMEEPTSASRFLGLEISLRDPDGTTRCADISQNEYTRHVLETFEQHRKDSGPLRRTQTPACDDELNNLGVSDDSDKLGEYAAFARMFIGQLLYLMRGSRAELALAVAVIGAYVGKWSVLCDKALTRIMAYLSTFPRHTLTFTGDSRDLEYLESTTFVDSDHGSHRADSRSMSGCICMILGMHCTRALIAWFAVHQASAAFSTGEAEVAATSIGLRRVALPTVGILEDTLGAPSNPVHCVIVMKLRGDAQVAEYVIMAGRSKQLRYMRKNQRVSIHFVHDVLGLDGHEFEHVPSELNPSDLFTKAVPRETHFRHMEFMSLIVYTDTGEKFFFSAGAVEPSQINATKKVLKLSRRKWTHPVHPDEDDHHLLHLPAHPECTICQMAKICVTPARRNKDPNYKNNYGERVYLDIVGPVEPDFAGNRYLLVGRDEATDKAMLAPMPNKSSDMVTESFKPYAPGIQCVRPDWGKEFEGRFEAFCRRHQISIERGLPRRSTNYARAERFHRTLEEGVRAALLQAGFSLAWWSWACLLWAENWNRISHEDRIAPFVAQHKRESSIQLRPFGSLIFFLKDKPSAVQNLPKFEPRGEAGCVIGYGAYGSYCILVLAPFMQSGRRHLKRTRDVKIPCGPPRFPVRDIMKGVCPEVSWHLRLPCEQAPEPEELSLPVGVSRCVTCQKFVTDKPVACEACVVNKPANKRLKKKQLALLHVDSHLCDLRRCKCEFTVQQDGAEVPAVGLTHLGEPVEEATTMADITFKIGDDLGPPPSDVGSDFVEPEPGSDEVADFVMACINPSFSLQAQEAHDLPGLQTYCTQAVQGFAMVYQATPLSSSLAKSPGAVSAIKAEIANMERSKVYDDYRTAVALAELRRTDPKALVVFAHLLLGRKNSETIDSVKWKARLVAGGNWLTDAAGNQHFDANLHGAPTSLEAIRLVIWWATMHPLHNLLQADMCHAYLQAKLKGPPVYVVLPKSVWPSSWFGPGGEELIRHPTLRLRKAMYGLRRSGFDWMEHAERILTHHGWLAVRDYVDSLYYKPTAHGPLMLCIYVDDLLASGHESTLREALNELRV